MHPYVQRQLRRHLGTTEASAEFAPVLTAVSALLHDVDRERELDAAAMNELSNELQMRYERMQQSEQRYRLLFDESPMAMFAVERASHRVVAWNSVAETLFGYRPDEVLNRQVEALHLCGVNECRISHTLTIGVELPDAEVLHDNELFTRERRRLDTQIMYHAVELDNVQAVIVHVRDVTAQRASERAQRASDARFRAFFDYAGFAIHVLTFDGVIVEANPASRTLLGYDADELVGRQASTLSPDEDVANSRELARELRAGLRDTLTIERRFFHKDGHLVWGQLTVSLVFDGDGARMISMIQDISERKRMETQLVKQAFHDELTGLANRVLFRDRLHHALERRNRGDHLVAVILLDLDGFKRVNDSLGHAAGDELLKVIGRRIANTVRAGETVARLGGDEFAVVIESVEDGDKPEMLADRLLTHLKRPVEIGGRQIAVGVSIGIATAHINDDAESVLRNADTAMYAAKASGKGCVRTFDPSMHTEAMQWLERWAHPTRGIVPPGGFVSIAEESGLITSIGRWVLMDACRTATTWSHDDGFDAPSVSVNIAAKQLESDTLLNDVRLALGISGLDPRRLILELTESDVMREPEAVRVKLEALKELGVRLAIDDFGTGYSSLSYLQYFPVDELKIDRSLSVEVVAEGIEDIGQERYLRSINCDIGQGYLYSRPLPAQDVEAFLARARRPHPCGPTVV